MPLSSPESSLQHIIEKKMTEAFSPSHLELINDSHKHQGHKGSPNTGESHFTLRIKASAFEGLSRVKSHQLIYGILKQELKEGLHALSIVILND